MTGKFLDLAKMSECKLKIKHRSPAKKAESARCSTNKLHVLQIWTVRAREESSGTRRQCAESRATIGQSYPEESRR